MESTNTVLIIDDEPAAREALEALLASEGYQLEFAADGLRGLALAAELHPDIILLDVMMPGIDGFEVCRRLRADPVLAEVPIVMITALDDQESRLCGIEAGADDFISKPFNKHELRARVRTICRLNRYRKLLAERIRFVWIIEQSQEGYLVLDQSGKIHYANPQAQLFLNLSGETSELKFIDIVHQQYRCVPEDVWQQWESQPLPMTPNHLVRPETATARAFWLQAEELVLPDSTGLRRIVRLRDVTATINNQSDMRRFETTVRHKLVTPFFVAYMSLYTLKKLINKTALPTDEIGIMAAQAFDELEHLNQKLKDIFNYIDVAVLAQIGQQLELSQLPRIVNSLAQKLQIDKITVMVPAQLQAKCLTLSETTLETILWEILENAKKFHPQQTPQVDIMASLISSNPQVIQLLVRDDGIWLSPEQIRWAILPYIQGEKYFTGEARGLGLGLSLVNTLVLQAGGKVKLFNRKDQPGVNIELILPLEDR